MTNPGKGCLLISPEDIMTELAQHFLCCAECGVFRSKVAILVLCAAVASLPWFSICVVLMLQGGVMICAHFGP